MVVDGTVKAVVERREAEERITEERLGPRWTALARRKALTASH